MSFVRSDIMHIYDYTIKNDMHNTVCLCSQSLRTGVGVSVNLQNRKASLPHRPRKRCIHKYKRIANLELMRLSRLVRQKYESYFYKIQVGMKS